MPIIEDCTAQSFAPHPADAEAQEAGEGWAVQVNDFNWLRTTPSPNWAVLPPPLRRPLPALLSAPFGVPP